MKRNVAKDGIFTTGNLSPLKSVELTNLHDVLFYLNINAIEAKENEQ